MAVTKLSYRFWLRVVPVPILFTTSVAIFLYGRSSLEDKLVSVLFLILFTTLAIIYLRPLRRYVVDAATKTLTVESYFAKETVTYPLAYFDGVESTWENRGRGGPVQVLSFQKNGEVIHKLRGDYFKNLPEIEQLLLSCLPVVQIPRKSLREKVFNWFRKTSA